VYRVIDVIGTSKQSWEDATRNAVETATRSLRDLRIAEVQKLDVKIDGGRIVALSCPRPGLVQVRGLIGPYFHTRPATRRKFSPRIPRTAASP
jgi:dodecin